MNKEYLTYKCFITFLEDKMKGMKKDYESKLRHFETHYVNAVKENNENWKRSNEDRILQLNSKIDVIDVFLRDYKNYFKEEQE